MIAVHCGHGERAATAVSLLERQGFRNLALVAGGVPDWERAGGAVERGDVGV
jgi:rhodanese-related sulfurtransferase